MPVSETLNSSNTIQFKYFFIISTLFAGTWLIANITAVKLVLIFGVTLTGGFIVFPFTTMLSSIIVEVYGYKNARQSIWAGFLLNLSFVFFINIVSFVPSSPRWGLDQQFNSILIPESRIIFASLIAFLLSDFSNSYFMAKFKMRNAEHLLVRRILICCALSIAVDIACFMGLAFYGTLPTNVLLKLMLTAYMKKALFQIALLPVIVSMIRKLKIAENIEIYDYDTNFNPFSIDNVYDINSVKTVKSNKVGCSSVLISGKHG